MTCGELGEALGFCGCGNPKAAIVLLRNVLTAIEAGNQEEAGRLLGGHGKALYWTYFYWLDNREWMEHGHIADIGWLCDTGKALLAALQTLDVEAYCEGNHDVRDPLPIMA